MADRTCANCEHFVVDMDRCARPPYRHAKDAKGKAVPLWPVTRAEWTCPDFEAYEGERGATNG